jgi:hypothetical protein
MSPLVIHITTIHRDSR